MTDLAIVVVGYDRPHALSRLLASLDRVAFDGRRVPLILSLDRADSDDTLRVAEAFAWRHGEKVVRTFPRRQGLKEHVLSCGDLTEAYGHLLVLEDDLYVSPNLHRFAVQAIARYQDDDRIAGIALYSHLWNVGCERPFQPLPEPTDACFMQFACSWGQIWSRRGWASFRRWLALHGEEAPGATVPRYVARWSDHSWLKHHIRYCVETGRFFVYPRVSLATNFSDRGQHNEGQENGYQVPLQEAHEVPYRFPDLDGSKAVYDAFFESARLHEALGLVPEDLCVDLYGMKGHRPEARYWLSLEAAPYRVAASFDLALRPHEANILHAVPGGAIRLYDTTAAAPPPPGPDLADTRMKYDVRCPSYKSLLRYSLRLLRGRLKAKLTGRG